MGRILSSDCGEVVYLHAYATVAEAKAGIGAWLRFYNKEHQHHNLGYRTLSRIYQKGLWRCGQSALPKRLCFPRFASKLDKRGNAAFASIPRGTTANK